MAGNKCTFFTRVYKNGKEVVSGLTLPDPMMLGGPGEIGRVKTQNILFPGARRFTVSGPQLHIENLPAARLVTFSSDPQPDSALSTVVQVRVRTKSLMQEGRLRQDWMSVAGDAAVKQAIRRNIFG